MPILLKFVLSFVIAYLLGSISFAIIVSKVIYKKDVRQFGSGNAGMTNMLRTFGKKAAVLTITGDVLKGTAAVMIARLLFWNFTQGQYLPEATNSFVLFATFQGGGFSFEMTTMQMTEIAIYLAVLGAFLGHLYPVYFKFRGGKGMSVIAGAMIAATPLTLALALSIFLVIAFGVKIVSLASVVSSVSYFIITLLYFKITGTFSVLNLAAAIIFPSFILYSHRENIKRLIKGTEYKFGQKK